MTYFPQRCNHNHLILTCFPIQERHLIVIRCCDCWVQTSVATTSLFHKERSSWSVHWNRKILLKQLTDPLDHHKALNTLGCTDFCKSYVYVFSIFAFEKFQLHFYKLWHIFVLTESIFLIYSSRHSRNGFFFFHWSVFWDRFQNNPKYFEPHNWKHLVDHWSLK